MSLAATERHVPGSSEQADRGQPLLVALVLVLFFAVGAAGWFIFDQRGAIMAAMRGDAASAGQLDRPMLMLLAASLLAFLAAASAMFFLLVRRDGEAPATRAGAGSPSATAVAEAAKQASVATEAALREEFRNPLVGIVERATQLQETTLSAAQMDLVGAIRNAGSRLLERIDGRLENLGDGGFAGAEFALLDVAEAAIEEAEPRAWEKGLTLVFAPSSDVPLRVAGDAAGFRRALVGLVGECIACAETGAVVVRAMPHGNRLRFEAEGFHAPVVATSSAAGPGSWRETIAAMGGETGSRTGEGGTTFWLDLPVAASDAACFADTAGTLDLPGRVVLLAPSDAGGRAVRDLLAAASLMRADPRSASPADSVLIHTSLMVGIDPSDAAERQDWAWIAYGPGARAWRSVASAVIEGAVTPSSLFRALTEQHALQAPPAAAPESASGAQAEPEASNETLDRERLRLLAAELGPKAAGELLSAFWADAAMLTAEIEEALSAGDCERAARALNTLRNGADGLGIAACSRACERLRTPIEEGRVPPPEFLAALLASLASSQRALAEIARAPGRASA